MTQHRETREAARAALALLQREFPDAVLTEVRLMYRVGERHDNNMPSQNWAEVEWTVQVGNDRACGHSPEAAIAYLRRDLELKVTLRGSAERIVAVLREIPETDCGHQHVLHEVQCLLERGRRERR